MKLKLEKKAKVRVTSDRCGTKGQILVTLWKVSGGWWACRPIDDASWSESPQFYLESELEPVT